MKLTRLCKKILRICGKTRGFSEQYTIPADLIIAIREDERITNLHNSRLSLTEFVEKIEHIFEQFDNDVFSYSDVNAEIAALFRENLKLGFVQRVRNYKVSAASLILLSRFCLSLINDDEDLNAGVIQNHCADRFSGRRVIQQFINGEHELIKKGLVEHAGKADFSDAEIFSLTEKARTELLSEFKVKEKLKKQAKDIISAESITEKKLFYNVAVLKQVPQLITLPGKDHFTEVQKRLGCKGMHRGFACLFYGPPGTGKTEAVCLRTVEANSLALQFVPARHKSVELCLTALKYDAYRWASDIMHDVPKSKKDEIATKLYLLKNNSRATYSGSSADYCLLTSPS